MLQYTWVYSTLLINSKEPIQRMVFREYSIFARWHQRTPLYNYGHGTSSELIEYQMLSQFLSPLKNILIDFSNDFKFFNYYKYTFSITNMRIIIICLLVQRYYYFYYISTRLHSSRI